MNWIRVTNPEVAIAAWVWRYGNGAHPVWGNTEQPLNAWICKSGMSSGYECGVITDTDFTYQDTAGVWLSNMREFNACVTAGDSGGSVIAPTINEAQGITNGGNMVISGGIRTNCHLIPAARKTYYSPIKNAQAWIPNINLTTVQTCGRLTSGYRAFGWHPVRRTQLVSCNNKFQLVVNNGWLRMLQWGTPVADIAWVGNGGHLWMNVWGVLSANTANGQLQWSLPTGGQAAEMRLTNNGGILIRRVDGSTAHLECPYTSPCN